MSRVKCLTCDNDYDKAEIVNGLLTELGYECPMCLFIERDTMKERKYYAKLKKGLKLAGTVLAMALVAGIGWLCCGCTATVTLKYPAGWSLGNSPDNVTTTTTNHPTWDERLERYEEYRNNR